MEERLQKYMARCGVASRRKCEEIILDGRVQVNGEIVKELGFKIDPNNDLILLDSKKIEPEERKVYIALNKPTGVVSTVKDERGRKTLLDLIPVEERIYPIGRLDYDTSGLILLTNDGDVYNKIIHPRKSIDKVYISLIKGIPSNEAISRFCNGVNIDGYITAPAQFEVLKKFRDCCEVKVIIHEGKNRQIRKMCDAIGHPVIELRRITVATIQIGSLKEGDWRYLTPAEIEYLKNL